MIAKKPLRPISKKPEIEYQPSELAAAADSAVDILRSKEIGYARAGSLVRIVTYTVDVDNGVDVRLVKIAGFDRASLSDEISRSVTFVATSTDKRSGKTAKAPIGPPRPVIEAVLSRGGRGCQYLNAVVSTPMIASDGRIIEDDGYDRLSGYFVRKLIEYPSVPTDPTYEDAQHALSVLKHPFRSIPFASPIDRAVVIAGLLATIVGPTLPTKPAIGLSANMSKSGKTLAINIVTMIALGAVLEPMVEGTTAGETEKRIDGLLLEGKTAIHIDNVIGVIGDQKLCALLTSRDTKVRPLGTSDMPMVRTPQVFLNGNKLSATGDFTRRLLLADLDPDLPEHQGRDVSFNALEEARRDRPKLVIAALTILRAYEVAGRPVADLPDVGSFEDWSQRVRNALVWLDEPDVALSMTVARNRDPERQKHVNLLSAWEDFIEDSQMTTGKLIERTQVDTSTEQPSPAATRLHKALIDVALGDNGQPCAKRLGIYLGKIDKVTINSRHITRRKLHGDTLWYLHRLAYPIHP